MQTDKIFIPHPSKATASGCISLIGMAASGKSTIGRELAKLLDWAHADSDYLIESLYGVRLQDIADSMDKESFLDLEAEVISKANLKRVVISTGGSAIYREKAMQHLRAQGPVVCVDVPLPVILVRLARKPERGMVMNPGQTIEDLYNERQILYKKYSTHTIAGGEEPAVTHAYKLATWLEQAI